MIATLQRHNNFLVAVLAVTVFAFVGAGFVGWGSYNYSSSASAIAKVGDEEVSRAAFSQEYARIYSLYSQFSEQALDEKQEREIEQITLASLVEEALLVSYARDLGLRVSAEEISAVILRDPTFQNNGVFDKNLYKSALINSRQDIKTFEARLEKMLLVQKLENAIDLPLTNSELEAVLATREGQDKIMFKVINPPTKFNFTNEELKTQYENNKNLYMGEASFDVLYVSAAASDQNVTDEEITKYYENNVGEFLEKNGEVKPLESVKDAALQGAKMAKARREALILKNAWGKDEITPKEAKNIELNNKILPYEVMQAAENAKLNELSDPIAVNEAKNSAYFIMKLTAKKEPEPLSFESAKALVEKDVAFLKTKSYLKTESESQLKNFKNGEITPFVSRGDTDKLKGLDDARAGLFLNKVFTSKSAEGVVELEDKAIIYRVLEQKLLDDKLENAGLNDNIARLKTAQIRRGLLESLKTRYQILVY
ncbi:MAG: SurA N-terminal domain-containing protein [Helicobacteraceae bacterium]|jgi:peptidyl-prolyl cis-trans isomerase D|nr:SurA N-terminal domain-containing protein [Helicobacteraceae bacterium]